MTEAASYLQLQAYLSSYGCNVETVTIIRERSSGTCTFVSAFAYALTSFAVEFTRYLERLWIRAIYEYGARTRLCRSSIPFYSSSSAGLTRRQCDSRILQGVRNGRPSQRPSGQN